MPALDADAGAVDAISAHAAKLQIFKVYRTAAHDPQRLVFASAIDVQYWTLADATDGQPVLGPCRRLITIVACQNLDHFAIARHLGRLRERAHALSRPHA